MLELLKKHLEEHEKAGQMRNFLFEFELNHGKSTEPPAIYFRLKVLGKNQYGHGHKKFGEKRSDTATVTAMMEFQMLRNLARRAASEHDLSFTQDGNKVSLKGKRIPRQ